MRRIGMIDIDCYLFQRKYQMALNIIKHYPVMAGNAIYKIKKCFSSKPIKVADCNFGFGGHTRLILKNFPKALVQAYDLDPKVIQYFRSHYQSQLTETELKRLTLTQNNFSSISKTKLYEKFDVILADFGFNSFHLQTERGFSWMKDQDLDMRYSPEGRTCSEIVNESSQLEIMSILQRYGDLRGGKSVSEAIIAARPIRTTEQLRDAIVKCFQDDKTRKIAQVFQAFRIATNNEIKDIEKLCNSLEQCLEDNGIFIGITFHSIERDTIHSFIREKGKLFSKAEVENPSKQQISQNSKSRSAKMLSFMKLK